MRPFVDFYAQNQISPVTQDISDLQKHFSRRDFLYRYLGLSPLSFEGKRIIEFGPGSGHNALYIVSRKPARYVLVDGNPTAKEHCASLFAQYMQGQWKMEFVLSDIVDFVTNERFDIVLCEGVIPLQKNPADFARHIAHFVKPGGVLVLTTIDYVSCLPELLRRLICACVIPRNGSIQTQLDLIRPIMKAHFETLEGRSRPIDDWILDNIINPWRDNLFSMADAISTLDTEFDLYGASPHIFTDWRWYKKITIGKQQLNQRAIEAFSRLRLSFLDHRFPQVNSDPALAAKVSDLSEEIFRLMTRIEEGDTALIEEAANKVEAIILLIRELLPVTATALREVVSFLKSPNTLNPMECFPEFKACFGQAQQYLSFVRRPETYSCSSA